MAVLGTVRVVNKRQPSKPKKENYEKMYTL